MKALIRTFDTSLIRLVTSWPESWRSFFVVVTNLGDPIVTIGIGVVVTAVGFAQANVRLMIAGAAVWATLGVGSLLKLAFGRERPLTEYAANLRVDTFSFPSGHSSGAMVAYGLLAYLAWQLLPQPWALVVTVVCAAIVLLVGISRVYLGAHFPSDVLAGWLLGLIALVVIVAVVRPLA